MRALDLTPYLNLLVVTILWYLGWRVDQLGKQIETVRNDLLIELGNEETRTRVLREQDREKGARKRETRFFWQFWTIVGLAVLIIFIAATNR
jgi:hypothetical protein